MAQKYKFSDEELSTLCYKQIANAVGYEGNDDLSSARQDAFDRYMGEPYGDEIPGRSKVVSTDVADVIEWIMPQLLRIFTSGERVVNFEPTGPEDEDFAEAATEYVNYIVNRDNPGFKIIYEFFKDALLFKLGVTKQSWEVEEEEEFEEYTGLPDADFIELVAPDDVRVDEHTEYEEMVPISYDQLEAMGAEINEGLDPPQIPMLFHDVKLVRTRKKGRVGVDCLPPEEFLIGKTDKDIPKAAFIAHWTRKTRTDLIEMDLDVSDEVINNLPAFDTANLNEEKQARREGISDYHSEEAADRSMDLIDVYECYIRIDMDGDGKAELWKVLVGGTESGEVLSKERVDKAYFAVISPILMPHRLHGRSVAEMIMDLARIKTTVLRQLLDNMYNQNNASNVVSTDSFHERTWDDLQNKKVGRNVRVKGDVRAAIMPMITPSLHDLAIPLLNHIDEIRENRTGVTKYNQGIDANSLNKTAQGINQILGQAAMRIELIARVFAETGMRDLFRNVLELVCKHQDYERMIRLRETWVPMTPQQWNWKMDVTTAVGLGTGDKERQFAILERLLQEQKEVIVADPQGGMVKRTNIYNTYEKMVEAAGLKSVDPFFSEPDENAPPPGQGREDPMAAVAQAQAQAEMRKAEVDAMKLELEREKMMRQDDFQRDKLDAETVIKITEIYAKFGVQGDMEYIRALMEMNREERRAAMEEAKMTMQAQERELDRRLAAQQAAQQAAPTGMAAE